MAEPDPLIAGRQEQREATALAPVIPPQLKDRMTQAPPQKSPRRPLVKAFTRAAARPFRRLSSLPTAPAAPLPVFEPLESRQLLSGSGDLYFGATISRTDDPSKVIPILKDAGAKSVRYWLGTDFKTKSTAELGGHFARIHQYASSGIKVDLIVTTPENTGSVPQYGDVKSWYSWLLKAAPQLKGDVDRWEIGNEPNLTKYFPTGNLTTYVRNELKPAYEVLHAAGETVVGGAIMHSVNRAGIVELKNAGYKNYADILGLHPYSYSAAKQIDYFKMFVDVMGTDKPISLTEWNILLPTGGDDHSKVDSWEANYINEFNTALDYIAPRVESIYYYDFAQRPTGGSNGGQPSSLTYKDSGGNFTRHAPFFDWFKAQATAANNGVTPQSKPKPTPKPAPKPAPKPTPPSNPAPAPSSGGGQTFTPVEDTYIRTYDNSTHGRESSILVKDVSDSHYDRSGLLKFDLSKLSGEVSAATVRVYGSLQKSGSPVSLEAYPADTNFSEGSANWGNEKPNATGGKLDSVTVSGTGDKWYDLDVTKLIQDAKSKGNRYVAIVLKAVQPGSAEAYVKVNSKEASSGKPQLAVSSTASTGGATPSSTGSKSIRPSDDTYVRQYDSSPHGSEKSILVKEVDNAQFNRDGLIKFNLAGLSKNLKSAKINLYGGLDQSDSAVKVDVYQTGTGWSETSASWNRDRQGTTGSKIGTWSVSSTADQWFTLDVTGAVKAAQKAGKDYIAFGLQGVNTKSSDAYAEFNSREASSNQPKLTVA